MSQFSQDSKYENPVFQHCEKSKVYERSVGLKFPLSCHHPCTNVDQQGEYYVTPGNRVFIMSLNDACKSDFLSTMFEEAVSIENLLYFEFTIPKELYRNVRSVDVAKFIRLWIGIDVYFSGDLDNDYKHCWKDIARLSQALLLSSDLRWVTELEKKFPPIVSNTKMQGYNDNDD
jgi:hypothetical protein